MLASRLQPPRLGCQRPAHGWSALRSLSARAGKKAARKVEKKAAQALKLTRTLQREEAEAFRSGKVFAGSARHSTGVDRPNGYVQAFTHADLVTRCFRTSTTRPAHSSSAP